MDIFFKKNSYSKWEVRSINVMNNSSKSHIQIFDGDIRGFSNFYCNFKKQFLKNGSCKNIDKFIALFATLVDVSWKNIFYFLFSYQWYMLKKNEFKFKVSLQKTFSTIFILMIHVIKKIKFKLKLFLQQTPSTILKNWIYIKDVYSRNTFSQFFYQSNILKNWIYTKSVSSEDIFYNFHICNIIKKIEFIINVFFQKTF